MANELKSLSVNNETYLMIKKKQAELIEKSRKYIQMTDITDLVIKSTINNISIDNDKNLRFEQTDVISKDSEIYEKHINEVISIEKGGIIPVKTEEFKNQLKEMIEDNSIPAYGHKYTNTTLK
jgi:hypothetical protein